MPKTHAKKEEKREWADPSLDSERESDAAQVRRTDRDARRKEEEDVARRPKGPHLDPLLVGNLGFLSAPATRADSAITPRNPDVLGFL